MSKHKNIIIMLIFTIFIAVLSIGGVVSTWDYVSDYANEYSQSVDSGIFLWQELPTGDEGVIIEQTGTKVEESMNNAKSELTKAIDDKALFGMSTVSSVDNIHGSQIRSELGLDPTANFLVDFKDPNTRILYSTTVEIGGSSTFGTVDYLIPKDEWVYPVYRTKVVLDNTTGKWVQESTQRGYAKSGEYVTFFSAAPFFDPNTWTRGKLGTQLNNAVYVYIGQNVKVSLDTAEEKSYYKIVVPNKNTVVNVNVTLSSTAKIKVLNANGGALGVASNNSQNVKFKTGKKNQTYYIEVSGDTNINFSIS